MVALTTRQVSELVGGELHGDGNVRIEDVAALPDAGDCDLVFAESDASLTQLGSCRCGAILIPQALLESASEFREIRCLIVVPDPMAAFITAMLQFRPEPDPPQTGISSSAFVSETATFGANCQIFPGATVGENVKCGDHCIVYPGAFVGAGCRLGDHVTIHPNAVLYPGVSIGNRSVVHAAAVIGADGFGYRFSEGRFEKIPHTGTVILEDDVEVGAGTTVDRAMIGATRIGEGTKIDNQVMIAHNCRVGRHNVFASQVGLAGSSTSGDYVRCGGQAGIADHSHLGTGSSIGAKAGLFGTVPDGAEYHGYPAGPAKEQYRIVMTMQKLPEMRKQIRGLEDQLEALRSQLANYSNQPAPTGSESEPPAAA